ncbi:cysteine--tRNA ligase [Sphingomonas sp. KRR8]|uniref:cysteine--tRNA ligase n=1 Tax=Sphingomonas sp. KRR8 TaxID=2942996 RepID=UPI0020215304|nr:cysteine--tRNA ligase [Sphingomonas sp. KRR8]URD61199.1 cysteine--tRNA ligase [Sphingomonas sp. KRR8]
MIRLYDTQEREKRDFTPGEPDRITLYVCGPTVYGRAHIGNARPPVVFDVLRRLLEHEYPKHEVVFARNITDVDDKIIASATAEGVEPGVITERFEQAYLDDMRALGVRDPTIAPHATQEIGPMVAMIADLIERGHAYAAQGHVLFDVGSDPDYGALSRRDREAMLAGARVEVAPYKRSPGDFVLWKPSAPDVIGWDSPWGRGRPGWHIECSAMIRAHLGETIDIHGGGIDLVFPHHENEAAQSRCAHGGKPLARYWVHNGFVDFGSEKMSKSLGNVVTPRELLDAGHKGEVLRLALLSAHYRSPLPWTEALVAQSKARLDRWYGFLQRFSRNPEFKRSDRGVPLQAVVDALSDDLNTPQAVAEISAVISSDDEDGIRLGDQIWQAINGAKLLGLMTLSPDEWFRGAGDAGIDARVAERTAAKQARDFATADRIRDELKAEGILLEDGAGGTSWRRA